MFLLIHEIFMMIMILAMMPMVTLVWAKRRKMRRSQRTWGESRGSLRGGRVSHNLCCSSALLLLVLLLVLYSYSSTPRAPIVYYNLKCFTALLLLCHLPSCTACTVLALSFALVLQVQYCTVMSILFQNIVCNVNNIENYLHSSMLVLFVLCCNYLASLDEPCIETK